MTEYIFGDLSKFYISSVILKLNDSGRMDQTLVICKSNTFLVNCFKGKQRCHENVIKALWSELRKHLKTFTVNDSFNYIFQHIFIY